MKPKTHRNHFSRMLLVLLLLLSLCVSIGFGTTYAKYQYNSTKNNILLNVTASYSISYFDQGGEPLSGTLDEDTPYTHVWGTDTPLKGATKDGYAFEGWFADEECAGSPVTLLGKNDYKDKINLYARWRLDRFSVTLSGDDGIASTDGAGSYDFGGTVQISATLKDGYSFLGWYDGDASVSTDNPYEFTMPDHDVSYQAKSELIPYTITYNSNGGSAVETQEYNITTSVTLADASQKTGYLFDAWKLASPVNNWEAKSYAKKEAVGTGKFGNIRLDAEWNPITYTVSYAGGGATAGSMETRTHIYDVVDELTPNAFERKYIITYNHNGSAAADTTATAAYTFKNWSGSDGNTYLDQQLVSNLASTQDANVLMTANWNSGSVVLETPTRTGYTFGGWYEDAACSEGKFIGNGGENYTPTAAKTLYAQWTPITYTVSYAGGGATGGSTKASTHTYNVEKQLTKNGFERKYTVTYNHNVSGTADTSDTAVYSFTHWTDANGKPYDDQQSVKNLTSTKDATITMTANWDPDSITLESPTRIGYIFGGWYAEADCTNKIGDAGEDYTPTADQTVYAKWTPITYTVSYDGNQATAGSMETVTHTYDEEKKLTANAFERKYTITYNHNGSGAPDTTDTAVYSFKHWTDSDSNTYEDQKTVKNLASTQDANVTLKAEWEGGSIVLEEPTFTGYHLVGWYEDAACSDDKFVGKGGATYTPTENKTLYAKWTILTYTVRYEGGGATGGSTADSTHTYGVAKNLTANGFERKYTITYNHNGSGAADTSATATYTFKNWLGMDGNPYEDRASVTNLASKQDDVFVMTAQWNSASIRLENPGRRTGYTFGGWYEDAACSDDKFIGNGWATYTPTATQTIYAKWNPITYTISYAGNGETGGSTASSTHAYDVPQELTANGFERKYTITYNHDYTGSEDTTDVANYPFLKWQGSNGETYNDKETVTNLTTTQGATIRMTAQWDDEADSTKVVLETPIRTGYKPEGWVTRGTWGRETPFGDCGKSITLTSNQTVYAKWTPITYTVSYNAGGGSGTMNPSTLTYDDWSRLTRNSFTRNEVRLTYNYNYAGSSSSTVSANFSFKDWVDRNGTTYADQAYVTNLSSTDGDTFVLTAEWNGGFTLETPIRSGYRFDGWYSEEACTNKIGSGGDYYQPASNNSTIYAKWINSVSTLKPGGNGGASSSFTNAVLRASGVTNPSATTPIPFTELSFDVLTEEHNEAYWKSQGYTKTNVSADANNAGTIQIWLDSTKKKVLILSENDILANANCSELLRNWTALNKVNFGNFYTENITNMSNMFYGCSGLSNLDITGFNTSNVTNMSGMFNGCNGLSSLDVTHFNTAKVTNMSNMFNGCSGLSGISVTNFNTAKVTNMSGMFQNCSNFTTLNVVGWDIGNVSNFSNMFNGCSKLTTIYSDRSWYGNTPDDTTSTNMFLNCTSIKGGEGTTYSADYVGLYYARIDSIILYVIPRRGYFTESNSTSNAVQVQYNVEGAGI